MRTVTFTLQERIVLTPVELQIVLKPTLIITLVLFVLSGIGPEFFSFSGAWSRGFTATVFLVTGMVSGAVITPALLPYIPGREFALKGIIAGSLAGLVMLGVIPSATATFCAGLALFLFCVTISSFLAMNFTGTTPFTSPSGVEKEMKRHIPIQLLSLVLDEGKCIGCSMCTEVCPHHVLEMHQNKARIVDFNACMECGACVNNCPDGQPWGWLSQLHYPVLDKGQRKCILRRRRVLLKITRAHQSIRYPLLVCTL